MDGFGLRAGREAAYAGRPIKKAAGNCREVAISGVLISACNRGGHAGLGSGVEGSGGILVATADGGPPPETNRVPRTASNGRMIGEASYLVPIAATDHR